MLNCTIVDVCSVMTIQALRDLTGPAVLIVEPNNNARLGHSGGLETQMSWRNAWVKGPSSNLQGSGSHCNSWHPE